MATNSNNRIHLPDALLPRLRARDESAYRQLIDISFTPLVRFANDFVDSLDQSEDIVQDVLVKIFEMGSEFNPSSSLTAYLFGAVRNRCLNVIRDRGVAGKYNALLETEAKLAGEVSMAESPSLDAMIKNLTEQQRTVINLRYVEQLTIPEISEALGVTISATEKLLARAHKSLKDQYRPG